MAPTEILAEQHYRKLAGWLAPLGLEVAWLSGSRKEGARGDLARLAAGEILLAVGTHALIEDLRSRCPAWPWRWWTNSTLRRAPAPRPAREGRPPANRPTC